MASNTNIAASNTTLDKTILLHDETAQTNKLKEKKGYGALSETIALDSISSKRCSLATTTWFD